MLFPTILTNAILAIGVTAKPQDDELPFNVIGSRIWSSSGCGNNETRGNLGTLTTHRDELGDCFKFSGNVKSIIQTGHAQGCKLLVFQDNHCMHGAKSPTDSHCLKAPTYFSSYKTVCE
ncbi:uncharacterized protein FIESC28_05772 [Fusarium coffeatum]|uniref:Secreted protein n=1 Tax=Fusarium coffeatum TaxID=231269 RepID=A0A366RRA8_9HYPO|nr:uncharacterized protein FIESC28_05772 [Fusarium coffeatum]RBR18950.1 hypothetical protein FIESC28_05772 [Fusarium coffeatum]